MSNFEQKSDEQMSKRANSQPWEDTRFRGAEKDRAKMSRYTWIVENITQIQEISL